MGISRAILGVLGASCLSLAALPAAAANLYLTPEVGFLGGFVDARGDDNTSTLILGGKDEDWSPGGGLALGIAVPMNEIVPWDVGLPEWDVRFEIESITTADDFELKGQGDTVLAPMRMSLESVTTTFSLWFDFPTSDGIAALIGQRVPALDPVTFSIGVGPGFARHDIAVQNSGERRRNEVLEFAWQAGAGFGYQLTDRVTLSATYRYQGQGEITATLCCVTPVAGEFLDVDATQHVVVFGARIVFFGVPSPHKWYGRW
jgi:opacity protein-like surface antigen